MIRWEKHRHSSVIFVLLLVSLLSVFLGGSFDSFCVCVSRSLSVCVCVCLSRSVCVCVSDFFCGPRVSAVRLAGLEHVLHFTALEGKIYMRSYK